MAEIEVIIEKCNGCELCVKACPYGAIQVEEKKAIITGECNFCAACVSVCEQGAIVIRKAKREAPRPDEHKGVWIFAETRKDEISSVAFELLGKARKLAKDLKTDVCAVVLGDNPQQFAEELFTHGAQKLYLANHSELKDPIEEKYAKVMVNLIREYKPEIVLAGATAFGRSLMPKLAAMLNTGLTADCTELEIEPKDNLLLQTRPAFGGNIMATIVCRNARPQMATVRPHVMKKQEKEDKKQGEIIEFKADDSLLNSQVRLVDFIEEVGEKINLEDAEIIVSGGRGVGGQENFSVIYDLAEAIGGTVGASRGAVDAGWISYPHQVGQTGKTVSPKLYIACGISGAVQHLAGMQTSDIIVAVNKDPDAPIFNVATFGVVGNLFEVVPLITNELKEERGG